MNDGIGHGTKLSVALVLGLLSALVFTFTTFATIKYVDDKHAAVSDTLREIKADQKEIKDMVFKLYQRKDE